MPGDVREKAALTRLNERDRKVLDRYAQPYTNFIESNTAQADNGEEGKTKPQEGKAP